MNISTLPNGTKVVPLSELSAGSLTIGMIVYHPSEQKQGIPKWRFRSYKTKSNKWGFYPGWDVGILEDVYLKQNFGMRGIFTIQMSGSFHYGLYNLWTPVE
jgi:hypothetical protein